MICKAKECEAERIPGEAFCDYHLELVEELKKVPLKTGRLKRLQGYAKWVILEDLIP